MRRIAKQIASVILSALLFMVFALLGALGWAWVAWIVLPGLRG